MSSHQRLLLLGSVLLLLSVIAFAGGGFTGNFNTTTFVASTVPHNGDVNPYGVFVVPTSTDNLVAGHVLVSNFNNRKNLQGTGNTIMDISPDGAVNVFANIGQKVGQCPGGVGLTTALVVLRRGWVIVGSLPTKDGTAATAQAGCLIVLNSRGQVVETFSGGEINGPWDMTVLDGDNLAELFVTNVLNGTVAANGNVVPQGTVLRILLAVPNNGLPVELKRTIIGSGFEERTDPNALVIGPTGVGLGSDGTLYVADTLKNRIVAIHDAVTRLNSAGTGMTVCTVSTCGGLNGPLGLAIAPNGNILTVNSGDGNLVEVTPGGTQVNTHVIDTSNTGAGSLFGLAVAPGGAGIYFVDDGDNTLDLFH